MIFPLLLAHYPPFDLTPKTALAQGYVQSANRIAALYGLASLKRHMLPPGDTEVRYWGGFAWGTSGIVLHQHDGSWSAARVGLPKGHRPVPLPAPKLGWPLFWQRAKKLGLFTLPDQEQAGSKKGFDTIFDGYSTLVEFQLDGAYRAYFYNNPGSQSTWPPAKPMAALDHFIQSQFPR